ncbi:MAG: NAD(P)/FAD-dependent oxidoreductase [Actinomycetes bacterium]
MPAAHLDSLAAARPVCFWLDDPARPVPRPSLTAPLVADLVVVGGGFTGLWAALRAKERHPDRDVVLLEARTIGWAASGRNGGFCAASLTHGLANGLARFPDELDTLERLGAENLDGIEQAIRWHGIDCDFRRVGDLSVATAPWQVAELTEAAELARGYGKRVDLLDAASTRALLDSPTYLAGLFDPDGMALVEPARLAWGLADAAERVGVRIAENTPAVALAADRGSGTVLVRTPHGDVRGRRVALGTNAFPPLLRRMRSYLLPVYDYALATEPLSAAQLAAIGGWSGRFGVSDAGNLFHYYRLTRDDRIVWGGYDAIYYFNNAIGDALDQRPATFELLARNFFATFPALDGLRFSHRWGGVIDTCSRFSVFFGTAYGGRVAYAAGYTGLGVGASRFGADVLLDLLDGSSTERTTLTMVRRKPLPFPPEPLRYAVVAATRRSLASADANGGRRNLWLRALDRLGLGFDS